MHHLLLIVIFCLTFFPDQDNGMELYVSPTCGED